MSLTYLGTIHYILMTLLEGFHVSDCCHFDFILYSSVHVEFYASLSHPFWLLERQDRYLKALPHPQVCRFMPL